jgi:hypothetical protein
MLRSRIPSLPIAAILAVAVLISPELVRAEGRVVEGLHVDAQVLVSCVLSASVPRAGTPERANGAASFSVKCTRAAAAVACARPCGVPAEQDPRRVEYRYGDNRDDGSAVATVLF